MNLMPRLAIAIVASLYFTSKSWASGFDDLKAGYAAADKGADKEAIRLYSGAIASRELGTFDLAKAFSLRGNAWLREMNFDKAIEDYNEALRLNPAASDDFNHRGVAWAHKGVYDRAIADYSEAIRLNPRSSAALVHRGIARASLHDYDRAIADYDQAVVLDPGDTHAFTNRGTAWARKKDYKRAMADFSKALQLDPQNANALDNRAAVYEDLKQYDRAVTDLDEAIRLNPGDPGFLNSRCWAQALRGALQAALPDCDASLRLEKRAETLNSRGLVHLKLRNYTQAIQDYSAALSLDSKHFSSLYGRGAARILSGDSWGYGDLRAAEAQAPDMKTLYESYGISVPP